jgi:hypothetical protein
LTEATGQGWVAASEDFSKLILQVEDHKLVQPETTTKSGSDLYEYSGGALRQVNTGTGTCGARIVKGNEETGGGGSGGSPHAVSVDGSRVFFEAVPGSDCAEPTHLYVRVNGAETVDLGAYRFAGANSLGTEVLLEKPTGENPGLYLYETGSAPRFLSSSGPVVGTTFVVSEDLNAVYFNTSSENIYRYDIPTKTLSFVVHEHYESVYSPHVSRDGRYYYFDTKVVGGLPGGAVVAGESEYVHKPEKSGSTNQIYRYDSVEHVIECVSCASPFAPEPKLGSYFDGGNASSTNAGTPKLVVASNNGDFAFFQSTAALVPSDVDGEVIPEGVAGLPEHPEDENSVSGDVYEWRKDGIHGCSAVQGCLALITNGRGGYLNELLGTAEEGNDVFIYTSSQLVGQDNDTAGDIYDVRIDGGFPEPAGPVECKGDSCSTPFAAPAEVTPASATFQGAGDLASEVGPPIVVKKAVTKKKTKASKKKPKAKRKRSKKSKAMRAKKAGHDGRTK